MIQDQDGSLAFLSCGIYASCVWDTAATTMTVTLMVFVAPSGGSTPGMQIPARISTLIGISDPAGNVPDLAGTSDTLIDFE